MNELEKINETIFESIKHVDDDGNEYWYARELQKVLEYTEWRKFVGVIKKAINSAKPVIMWHPIILSAPTK